MEQPANEEYSENLEIYSPEQLRIAYREDNHPLSNIRKSRIRYASYVLILLIGAITYAFFVITIPFYTKLPFVLMNNHELLVVEYPFPVKILESRVNIGDQVKAGDTLLILESPELLAELAELHRLEASFRFFDSVTIQTQFEVDRQFTDRIRIQEALVTQIALRTQQHDSLSQELKTKLNAQLEKASKHLSVQQHLFEEGVISASALQTEEINYLQFKTERTYEAEDRERKSLEMKSEYLEAKSKLLEMSTQRQEVEHEHLQKKNQIQQSYSSKREALGAYGHLINRANQIALVATGPGTICYRIESSYRIQNQPLLQICDPHTTSYAVLSIPNHEYGKLRLEMQCTLTFDPFPIFSWGTAPGRLTELSSRPSADGTYFGKIDISIPTRLKTQLNPGVRGNAYVLTREQTLLEYLIENSI